MQGLAKLKVEKLIKRLKGAPEDLIDIRVVLNKGHEEGTFTAKVELFLGGYSVVGQNTEYSLETALISAVQDVERQFKKSVTKRKSEEWEERRKMKNFSEEQDLEDEK